MDLGIRGRKALLFGASRGLGRACALALAREGVDITIVARGRDALERTATGIAAATGAMMRLTVDGMMARGFGRIINIVSRSVKIPQIELGLSNGARSGLVGFVAGLARQTVGRNVTINNLLPGIFDSDAQRAHVHALVEPGGKSFEDLWRERAAANPAGRYGRPEELGAYCAFLCSEHAGFITGQNLLIDGGSYPGTY